MNVHSFTSSTHLNNSIESTESLILKKYFRFLFLATALFIRVRSLLHVFHIYIAKDTFQKLLLFLMYVGIFFTFTYISELKVNLNVATKNIFNALRMAKTLNSNDVVIFVER